MNSGISHERLARMHDVLTSYVERGEVPGLITCINRRGQPHIDIIGNRKLGAAPMTRDTIFRITSMTKHDQADYRGGRDDPGGGM